MSKVGQRVISCCNNEWNITVDLVNLINDISPLSLGFIYGDFVQRICYLQNAYNNDQGYFGKSLHKVILCNGKCAAVIASFTLDMKLRLDIMTLISIIKHYPPLTALRVIKRLIASAKTLSKPSKNTWYLYNLSVSNENRKKGFGTKLLNHEIELASSKGFNSIQLDVSISNEQAIKFYEKNRFNIVNEYRPVFIDGFVFDGNYRMEQKIR